MVKIYNEFEGPTLLRFLSQEDRQLLFANSESYDFNAGEHIIFQRDSEAILYLIESGRVEVLAGQGDSATRLAVLEVGEAIGEISFLSGQRRSANVVALDNATIRFFEPDKIVPLLQQNEGLAARFFFGISQILSKRLIDYNQKAVESNIIPKTPEVCLRIKHPTASWARGLYFHPKQTIEDIAGGIEVKFLYNVQPALLRQVLSLGPDAQVIKPDTFRQQIAIAARQMAKNHA